MQRSKLITRRRNWELVYKIKSNPWYKGSKDTKMIMKSTGKKGIWRLLMKKAKNITNLQSNPLGIFINKAIKRLSVANQKEFPMYNTLTQLKIQQKDQFKPHFLKHLNAKLTRIPQFLQSILSHVLIFSLCHKKTLIPKQILTLKPK